MASSVLIVDDDADIRALFHQALAGDGFATIEASSAAEAHAILSGGRSSGAAHGGVALVLCDLCLPDRSGLDVLKSLRASGDTARFVIITGQATVGTALEAMRCGADDYLEKPVWLDRIIQLARLHVGRTVPALAARPNPRVLEAMRADRRPLSRVRFLCVDDRAHAWCVDRASVAIVQSAHGERRRRNDPRAAARRSRAAARGVCIVAEGDRVYGRVSTAAAIHQRLPIGSWLFADVVPT